MSEKRTSEGGWVCNECGAHEYTGCVSEADARWMGCGNCGSDEFHWEDEPKETHKAIPQR